MNTSKINRHKEPVWPDWAIYWALGKFLKRLATIDLPKSPTFLGKFLLSCRNLSFCQWNYFWATFIDIWRFFYGHTGYSCCLRLKSKGIGITWVVLVSCFCIEILNKLVDWSWNASKSRLIFSFFCSISWNTDGANLSTYKREKNLFAHHKKVKRERKK